MNELARKAVERLLIERIGPFLIGVLCEKSERSERSPVFIGSRVCERSERSERSPFWFAITLPRQIGSSQAKVPVVV